MGFSEGSAPVAGNERWFADSELNVADTCFLNRSVGAPEEQVAIVWAREGPAWNEGENADREALRSKHLYTWTYVAASERVPNPPLALPPSAPSLFRRVKLGDQEKRARRDQMTGRSQTNHHEQC